MPVRRSRHSDPAPLIDALASPDAVVRESAAARLAVMGERAMPSLEALLDDEASPSGARITALRVISVIDRRAALDTAAACVERDDEALALDAVALLGDALHDSGDTHGGDRALDHLTRLVLTSSIPARRRLAIVDALEPLPARLRQPVLDALAGDTNPVIVARARPQDATPGNLLARWSDEEQLPASPEPVVDTVVADAAQTSITALARLVALARLRETKADGPERDGWRQARGLIHEALARRGSALARYDLRETLEDANQPVSAHFLAAAREIADASCLDAVATRWIHAGQDVWLRDQLERIFHDIVGRERLRRQSPVLTKLLKRHPAAGPLVATAPRSLRGTR